MKTMQSVFVSITRPVGMSTEEAVTRAKALVPVVTGGFELEFESEDAVCGNLECEHGYYKAHKNGASYGPDSVGVKLDWETP